MFFVCRKNAISTRLKNRTVGVSGNKTKKLRLGGGLRRRLPFFASGSKSLWLIGMGDGFVAIIYSNNVRDQLAKRHKGGFCKIKSKYRLSAETGGRKSAGRVR